MALTVSPIIGTQNLVDIATSFTGSDVVAGSTATSLADPNLGVTTNFGTGVLKGTTMTLPSTMTASLFFVRFRGGWEDIESVRLRASASSDMSAPVFDTTIAQQFPTVWPIGYPRRPIMRYLFSPESARYWRIDVERTAGSDNLLVARVYLGGHIDLDGQGHGVAAYGSTSFSTESASNETTGDLDTDFRFNRSIRRHAQVKVSAIPTDAARATWIHQFSHGAYNADSLFCLDHTATDAALIQSETLWGRMVLTGEVTFGNLNQWEATMHVRERL